MNSQDLQQLGINIFDIRDFVDLNFIKEYKESVILARKWLDTESKHCNNGTRRVSKEFVKYFERLLGKDYSYLKKENDYQLDYKFISDCFNYFDENNITELPFGGIPKDSTPLTELCVQADSLHANLSKHVKLYYEMSNIINNKIIKLIFGNDTGVRNGPGHLNVMPKNSYMAIHQDDAPPWVWDNDMKEYRNLDGTSYRPLTIMNYTNVNRTLEDGSLYRYFIPTEYNGKNAKSCNWNFGQQIHDKDYGIKAHMHIYEDSWTNVLIKSGWNYYDILPNYKTVLVMNTIINNGIFGNIPHMVTKNNSENIRYGLYIQTYYSSTQL